MHECNETRCYGWQDAMDDKIIEGCKTCEKQISQQEKCYAYRSQNTHTH